MNAGKPREQAKSFRGGLALQASSWRIVPPAGCPALVLRRTAGGTSVRSGIAQTHQSPRFKPRISMPWRF